MPAARVSQHDVEVVVQLDDACVRVSQRVVEIVRDLGSAAFSTVTGCGVSQDVVEVVISLDAPTTRVSQRVIEVLMSPATIGESGAPPPSGGGTVSFPIAV